MINRLGMISLLVAGSLAISIPVVAHHGNAAYETEKSVNV